MSTCVYFLKYSINGNLYSINYLIKEFLLSFTKPIEPASVYNRLSLELKLSLPCLESFFSKMVSRGIIVSSHFDAGVYKVSPLNIPDFFHLIEYVKDYNIALVNDITGRKFVLKQLPQYVISGLKDASYLKNILHRINCDALCNHISFYPEYELYGYQYFDGKSIIEYISLNPNLNLFSRLSYINRIVNVIADFHSKGIILGDISPNNLLVDKFGVVKFIDYDTFTDADSPIMVSSGSLEYLPPEKCALNSFDLVLLQNNTYQSDVYSLGILIYFILYGATPFLGVTWRDQLIMKRNEKFDIPITISTGERVPLIYINTIMKCLKCNSSMRYSDANGIANSIIQ